MESEVDNQAKKARDERRNAKSLPSLTSPHGGGCEFIARTFRLMSAAGVNHNEPPPGDVCQAVEHLFRHEAGKMVSILTGVFGLEHLNLAEDVIQEALARALQTWPYYGIPKNPSAWIMRVSRNLALDVVRREQVFRKKETESVF
jgi:hypothetical protein